MQADITRRRSAGLPLMLRPEARSMRRRMAFLTDRLRLRASRLVALFHQILFLRALMPIVAEGQRPSSASACIKPFASARQRHLQASSVRRVLIVDAHYPRPDCDSGSLRMWNLLALLRELGCHVQFWAAGATGRDAYSDKLEKLGVELVIRPTRADGLRWWYENGFALDAVLLSRLPVALGAIRLARRYAKNATIIFDTVDLHFLRIARGAALHGNTAQATWANELRVRELGLMHQADLTLVVSAYEQCLLRQLVPSATVQVLSNIHAVYGRQASFAERSGLLFLANFEHEPNVDAAHWLIEHVMPKLLAHLAGVTLHIVGHAASQVLAGCASDCVVIHGHMADLTPMMKRVKVAVAPLRYGAGVKGKINMAMSHGVPVVTTSVGAEGMSLHHRRDAMIADGSEAFARSIAEACTVEPLWLSLSDRGLENVGRYFSAEVARKTLSGMLRLPLKPAFHSLQPICA